MLKILKRVSAIDGIRINENEINAHLENEVLMRNYKVICKAKYEIFEGKQRVRFSS